jgi:hypothetical protein
MKQWIIILLTGIMMTLGCGAQNLKIAGQITDTETKLPLSGASILNTTTGEGTIAGTTGQFELSLDRFPATILIKFLGYDDYKLVIKDEGHFKNSFLNTTIKISLSRKITEIPGIEIKAVNRLFDRDPYAIIQYYLSGDHIISLA